MRKTHHIFAVAITAIISTTGLTACSDDGHKPEVEASVSDACAYVNEPFVRDAQGNVALNEDGEPLANHTFRPECASTEDNIRAYENGELPTQQAYLTHNGTHFEIDGQTVALAPADLVNGVTDQLWCGGAAVNPQDPYPSGMIDISGSIQGGGAVNHAIDVITGIQVDLYCAVRDSTGAYLQMEVGGSGWTVTGITPFLALNRGYCDGGQALTTPTGNYPNAWCIPKTSFVIHRQNNGTQSPQLGTRSTYNMYSGTVTAWHRDFQVTPATSIRLEHSLWLDPTTTATNFVTTVVGYNAGVSAFEFDFRGLVTDQTALFDCEVFDSNVGSWKDCFLTMTVNAPGATAVELVNWINIHEEFGSPGTDYNTLITGVTDTPPYVAQGANTRNNLANLQ